MSYNYDGSNCKSCKVKAEHEAQCAEIAELKDEVENLNGELIFHPKYLSLTERVAEFENNIAGWEQVAKGLEMSRRELEKELEAEIAKLEAENKELRKAIQAIDDIVCSDIPHELLPPQIWTIIEGVKEVK